MLIQVGIIDHLILLLAGKEEFWLVYVLRGSGEIPARLIREWMHLPGARVGTQLAGKRDGLQHLELGNINMILIKENCYSSTSTRDTLQTPKETWLLPQGAAAKRSWGDNFWESNLKCSEPASLAAPWNFVI